tara:strand:- start:123 stop:815 length:693 start_codon:yes stop_codon:yes gene_type:complete
MDRETRNLIHGKGNKVKIATQPPMPNEGDDGDMQLQTTGIGAILYVKGNGRWFKFQPNESSDDGWHGSSTKVRIVANDFMIGNNVSPIPSLFSVGIFGYVGVDNASDSNQLTATITIPSGYIPTAIRLYGITTSGTDYPNIAVRAQEFSAMGSGTQILSAATWDEERSLSGINKSHDDSYLQVLVTNFHGSTESSHQHYIRGGYIRIAPVITVKEVAKRQSDEDVLGRST